MTALAEAPPAVEAPPTVPTTPPPVSKFVQFTTRPAPKQPTRMLLYGPPGAGKTSFAAQAPKPIFILIRGETGLWTLQNSGCLPPDVPHFPDPADDWPMLLKNVSHLIREEHPYRTLVIDALSGLEQILHDFVCQDCFGNDWSAFAAYQAGPRQAVKYLEPFLAELDRLRARGMAIILIGHAAIAPFRDPAGKDWDRWTPALTKDTWASISKWADQTLFLHQRSPHVQTASKKATKGKATGPTSRVLFTGHSHCYEAKNRHGLPDEIDCGSSAAEAWANFAAAMKGGRP